eukprot:519588_1
MSDFFSHFLIIIFGCVLSQNDFLGNKYSAINNITTINLNNSTNIKTILAPSLIKFAHNPLFGQDKPWETKIGNGYPNIVYLKNNSNKTYQLWYSSAIMSQGISGELYAQSVDGINWLKPNLNLTLFNNSYNNNIIFQNSGGIGIFRDIYTRNISQQYKGFGQFPTVSGTATSKNGLVWTNFRALNLSCDYATQNNMFYDTKVNKYFGISRPPYTPTRTVAITKSNNNDFSGEYTTAVVVESGGPYNQTYSQITFEYYNIFLGLVMIYDSTSSNQRVYCELSWSPNMYNWYRINAGQELIPLSPLEPVVYDSYICFAAGYPIVVDNMVRLYYMGGNGPHYGNRNSSFALATMRMDGFAGLTNSFKQSVGIVSSYQLNIDAKYLTVSCDVYQDNENGSLRVGLLGIDGFEVGDCVHIQKNVTDYVVVWGNNDNLNQFIGKRVVIQFELIDAILYTFQFTNSTD